MAFEYTRADIAEYVQGKTWYWYLLLWLFGLYAFWKLLGFSFEDPMAFVVAVPYAFNFMLHEFAHIFTGFLPHILSAAAGSFSELILGSVLIFGAFKTRSYFASMFCCLWFMLACQSAGSYMSDARAQNMELVSLGGAMSGSDEVIHDWNFIFGELGLLSKDTLIGGAVKGVGILVGLAGVLFAAWLMYKMADAHGKQPMTESEKEVLRKSVTSTSFDKPVQKHATLYPVPTKGALAEHELESKSKNETPRPE